MRASILLVAACGRIGFDEVSEPPPQRLCAAIEIVFDDWIVDPNPIGCP